MDNDQESPNIEGEVIEATPKRHGHTLVNLKRELKDEDLINVAVSRPLTLASESRYRPHTNYTHG